MRTAILVLFATKLLLSCADAQEKPDPQLIGQCEGCEAVFEYGNCELNSVDTLPGFNEKGTRIKVTGTVYKPDGSTPAEGVILYVYHTDQNGHYATRGGETGWGKKHGYIRDWLKTDENGRYAFYTLKPAPYPNQTLPAHIHIIVLEPNGKYYWLGSYHFKGDPLLTDSETDPANPRGGSTGILDLREEKGILVGSRDIVLGKHVPGYD